MTKTYTINVGNIFLPLFFFLMMICIVGFFIYLDKKRKKETKDFCTRNGLTYQDKNIVLPMAAKQFTIVNIGAQRTISNVMVGTKNNTKFYIFEVLAESEKGYSRNKRGNLHLAFTVCLMEHFQTKFPSFYLRDSDDKSQKSFSFLGMELQVPNFYNFGKAIINPDKRYEMKGGKDIELTDYPDFCSNYILKGINEEEIYKYFTPERINTFIDFHQPCYQYEAKDNCFMVSTPYVLKLDDRLTFLKKSMILYNSLIATSNILA